jgi:hypothetical protein
MDSGPEESIKVIVRIRQDENKSSSLKVNDNKLQIFRNIADSTPKTFEFNFDQIFHQYSTQEDIFNSALPLVRDGLNGFNVNVFAFGMTGFIILIYQFIFFLNRFL